MTPIKQNVPADDPVLPPRPPGPARTFSDMGIPRPTKSPTFMQKLSATTRKLTAKQSPEEKAVKKVKKLQKKAAAEERARRDPEVYYRTRQTAIFTGHIPEDALRQLAEWEGVYLNPRPSRTSRFHELDFDLDRGLVARVSGRQSDGRFVFLGSDKRLYISRNELGRGATIVPLMAESHYPEAREVARAYYQLCR